MTKYKNIWEYIKSDTKTYYFSIIQPDGAGYFLKALSAKLLWVALGYKAGLLLLPTLLPIKNILYLNATVLLVGSSIFFAMRLFKEHLPEWVDDLISGRVFFKIDIEALNSYIVGLLAGHIIFFVYPYMFRQTNEYIDSLKLNEQK